MRFRSRLCRLLLREEQLGAVFANQKARAKTVAASVEREAHEHVLEPIAHGLEGFFGAAEEDGEEEKVDYDDDDDVDDDTDETVAADANADEVPRRKRKSGNARRG